MQISGIIQKTRNNGCFFQSPKERFKELNQAIKDLNQNLPFIGRILTRAKNYGGRIEKLRFEDGPHGYLKFIITDCDRKGQSSETAKTYKGKVAFEDLEDIQTF